MNHPPRSHTKDWPTYVYAFRDKWGRRSARPSFSALGKLPPVEETTIQRWETGDPHLT